MSSTKEKLMGMNIVQDSTSTSKISIVGIGQVGLACAFSLICQVDDLKIKC